MNKLEPKLVQALQMLADEFANGHPKVRLLIAKYLANPPKTLREIGIYGGEDMSPQARAVSAMVTEFDRAGLIFGFEDKYVYEMPSFFAQEGFMTAEDADALELYLFGGLSQEELEAIWDADEEVEPSLEETTRTNRYFYEGFVAFTRNFEAAVEKTGKKLIQFRVPLGDTLFYALVDPAVFDRWENTLLASSDDNDIYGIWSIERPNWAEFWGFLVQVRRLPDEMYANPPGGFSTDSSAVPIVEKF